MEVKSIYLDLQKAEPKKRGQKTVWKLESEVFKEPLELKIGYEDTELREVYREIADIKHEQELQEKKITKLAWDNVNHNLFREEFQNKINNKQEQIDKLRDDIRWLAEQVNWLYKVMWDTRNTIDTLNWATLQLQTETKDLRKKITRQPTVIHDKCFISGRESCWLWMINMSDGEYLMIAKYTVWEHNEFVTNCDEILFEKICVEWQHYIPFYKLEWGTELDTPTATIYYDLVFMPL